MPRVIHYLRCGCPATTRLDTKAIRCDCTKACPNQGCTRSFTMPRVIHYLRCGCPATTRLDTKAIRCDCTKACPNQGCTRSFTMPRVIHYLRCGWPAKKRFILQRYGVTVLELARAKFARNWKAILLKLICTKTFTDGFFTL